MCVEGTKHLRHAPILLYESVVELDLDILGANYYDQDWSHYSKNIYIYIYIYTLNNTYI